MEERLNQIETQLNELARAVFVINQTEVVTSFVLDYIINKFEINKEELTKYVTERMSEWEQKQKEILESLMQEMADGEKKGE